MKDMTFSDHDARTCYECDDWPTFDCLYNYNEHMKIVHCKFVAGSIEHPTQVTLCTRCGQIATIISENNEWKITCFYCGLGLK